VAEARARLGEREGGDAREERGALLVALSQAVKRDARVEVVHVVVLDRRREELERLGDDEERAAAQAVLEPAGQGVTLRSTEARPRTCHSARAPARPAPGPSPRNSVAGKLPRVLRVVGLVRALERVLDVEQEHPERSSDQLPGSAARASAWGASSAGTPQRAAQRAPGPRTIVTTSTAMNRLPP